MYVTDAEEYATLRRLSVVEQCRHGSPAHRQNVSCLRHAQSRLLEMTGRERRACNRVIAMCYHLCGIDSLSEEEIDMPHKSDPREKEMLLSEERQAALQPGKLLRRLGLRSGDTLADVGSGPGFFTLPAAQIVGPEGL